MPNVANYVQVSETLIDHPKTTHAIRILRINRMQLVGHLVAIWNWALKNAPDGDLSRFSCRDLSDAARFTDPDDFDESANTNASRFVEALCECRTSEDGCGFLGADEDGLFIHDWHDYGGKLLATRLGNARRKRLQRESEVHTAPSEPILPFNPSRHAHVTSASRVRHTGLLKERRGEESIGESSLREEEAREQTAALGEKPATLGKIYDDILPLPVEVQNFISVQENPERWTQEMRLELAGRPLSGDPGRYMMQILRGWKRDGLPKPRGKPSAMAGYQRKPSPRERVEAATAFHGKILQDELIELGLAAEGSNLRGRVN